MGQRIPGLVPLALLLLAFAGCGDSPATDSLELSGFVTRLGSDDGIGNARVIFISNTLRTNETTTNGNGFYEMIVEVDSDFGQVRAEADGFQPNEETVFFDSPSRRVDIALRPSGGE